MHTNNITEVEDYDIEAAFEVVSSSGKLAYIQQ